MCPKAYITTLSLSTPLSTPTVATSLTSSAQNEANMANESLKVEQPLLKSSSELSKLPCLTYTEHSPDTKTTVMGTSFPAIEFSVMESVS